LVLVAEGETSLSVSRVFDLVGEGDGEVRARDVGVPLRVTDEDVGAEAEGTGLRPRVVRAEPEGRLT
jgi:hypothetical protein